MHTRCRFASLSIAAAGVLYALHAAAPAPARAETLTWARTSVGPAWGADVAIGRDGNPYVAGSVTYLDDLLLRKYSAADGDALWSRRYRGSWEDVAHGVAVSPNGSVYVTGYSFAGGGGILVLRKYSASGALQWSRTWRPEWATSAGGGGVAVGPGGEVYVAGSLARETADPGLFTWDLLLQKYTASGALVWTRLYNGPTDRGDWADAVAVAADGAVYVAGATEVAWPASNVLVQKYTPGGALVWTRTYDGPAKGKDYAMGIAVGASGVYVAGAHEATVGNRNVLLRKYTVDGAVAWTRSFDGGANDGASGVALGPDGSVFVVGYTTVPGESPNVLVRKYSPAGEVLWRETYNTATDDDDGGYGVAVGGDGAVYVTGSTRDWFTGEGPSYLLLLKYQ